MNHLGKRTISILLFACAFLVINGCVKNIPTMTDEDGFIYEANGAGSYTVYLDNLIDQETIVVPSTYNDRPITAVGTKYDSADGITRTVTIPEGVLTILPYAFSHWRALATVELPASIWGLLTGAFYGCESLTSFTVPEQVITIQARVFEGCIRLASLVIGENVQAIDIMAFIGCVDLTEIEFVDNPWYVFQDGVLYDSAINVLLIYMPSNTAQTYRIIDGVTKIAAQAFRHNRTLVHLTVPGVWDIAEYAFNDCDKLETIVLEAGVGHIGEEAFSDCDRLSSVTFSESIETIDDGAFSNDSALLSIELPASVTAIGAGAFAGCDSLSVFTVSQGSDSFAVIENVVFTKELDELVFYPGGKTDSTYIVPIHVRVIKASAFEGNNHLGLLIIASGVLTIETRAFAECDGLNTAFIPLSVTVIGRQAFDGIESVILNCEAASKPVGWNETWATGGQTVIWGSAYHP
ncbi:MAG TPA: hypothetical protein DCR44_05930 [Acholeplasmatales bacterium]|nr:MAG: hypothetical protein A2Y16_06160 [Tenericutes bacterium GWF2_57_13]HAQ56917.1 hypothetical protein [Acholeplasmatales bacterium]